MKMPRHYATSYFSAKSKEEQREALKGCPAEWRELVSKHIEIRRERERWQQTKSK